MGDVEESQEWNDDPHDEVPPSPTKNKGCSKWMWVALTLGLAIVVIVPLTVVSIQKDNEAKAEAANNAGSAVYSPAMAPAMAPSANQAGLGETLVPTIVGGTGSYTTDPTSPAPTLDPLACPSATQLVCPATTGNSSATSPEWIQVANEMVGEAAGDLSGFQIATSCNGEIVAVGAGQNNGNGDRSGHVRVYQFNSTAWNQMGQDIDGEAEFDWFGHSVALASSGRRLAVGARFNNGVAGNDTGHVRVLDYAESSQSWDQIGQDVEGEAGGDQSGRSVAMSADGTRLAIGATGTDLNATVEDVGHVRVYDLVGDVWTQIGNTIDGEGGQDRFGRAVALSAAGDRVAIGGYTNDGGAEDAGHVRVYELVSSAWTQLGEDIDGAEAGDWSGLAVDISAKGDRVAVGAPGNNDRFVPGASTVYEFDDVSGDWIQLGEALEGGYSVSISGDGNRVAAGDYKGNSAGINAGQVRVYEFDATSGNWTLLADEISGNQGELSGTSVALSEDGSRVAISAPVYGDEVGATRVYDLC